MKLLTKSAVFAIVILQLAFAAPLMGQAQGNSLEEIKAQLKQAQDAIKQQQAVIDALQQRLAALEQAKAPAAQALEAAKSKPNLGDLSGLKIGGTYFLSYQNGVTFNPGSNSDDKTDNYSKFTLKRGYLTVEKDFTPWLKTRYTADLFQDSTSGQFNLRTRYLYADFLWKGNNFFYKPDMEVGMVHTPWIDFSEGIQPWRMQDTLFLERVGVFPNGDVGLTVGGSFGGAMPQAYQDEVSNKYAGRYGSFQIGLYNGGGYTAAEKNSNKVPMVRISVRPMPDLAPGLQLSVYGADGKGNVADTYWTKDGPFKGREVYPDFKVFDGALSFQHKYFSLMGEYYQGRGNAAGTAYYKDTDYVAGKVNPSLVFQARYQRGYSFFGQVRFPEERKWAIIGRMDYFDPDTKGVLDVQNNRDVQRRWITGVAYYLFKENIILVDYDVLQHSNYFLNKTKANPAGTLEKIPNEGRFQVTLQIKF